MPLSVNFIPMSARTYCTTIVSTLRDEKISFLYNSQIICLYDTPQCGIFCLVVENVRNVLGRAHYLLIWSLLTLVPMDYTLNPNYCEFWSNCSQTIPFYCIPRYSLQFPYNIDLWPRNFDWLLKKTLNFFEVYHTSISDPRSMSSIFGAYNCAHANINEVKLLKTKFLLSKLKCCTIDISWNDIYLLSFNGGFSTNYSSHSLLSNYSWNYLSKWLDYFLYWLTFTCCAFISRSMKSMPKWTHHLVKSQGIYYMKMLTIHCCKILSIKYVF